MRQRPALVLSYMSSLDHFDVPWPDYLFWGRPASRTASWASVLDAILAEADSVPFSSRLRRTLYASKLLVRDNNFFRMYMPLRRAFALNCLYNCTHAPSRLDAEVNVSAVLSSLDKQRASGALGGADHQLASHQFRYKCWYRSLLILNGRSAWLDHFKADVACGSPVIFVSDRSRPPSDGHIDPRPVSTFWSHLIREGEHYVHISSDHQNAGGLCGAVGDARRWMEQEPAAAACMGARAQAVVRRWLHMDKVYDYMAEIFRGIAATQDGEQLRRVVPSSSLFVRLNLSDCLRPELEAAATSEAFLCTQRALRDAALGGFDKAVEATALQTAALQLRASVQAQHSKGR